MEFDATIIIAAISFVVFVLIMNGIFYAPLLKIMKERQKYVEINFNNAEEIKEQTAVKNKYREEELSKCREEAREKITEQNNIFKQEYSKRLKEYKDEVNTDISNRREEMKKSAYSAKEILKEDIVSIAKDISQKILGSDVNTDGINKTKIEE